jgi:hypothetical protein
MSKMLQGYSIYLYVDRASWHRGEEVTLFLQNHTEIHLEYLPAYQPALNEQERIWRQGRYEVTKNVWFDSLDTLYMKFVGAVSHWSKRKIQRLCIII